MFFYLYTTGYFGRQSDRRPSGLESFRNLSMFLFSCFIFVFVTVFVCLFVCLFFFHRNYRKFQDLHVVFMEEFRVKEFAFVSE